MVYVTWNVGTRQLVSSGPQEPLAIPGHAVTAIERDYKSWSDVDWDPETRSARPLPAPRSPYPTREEIAPLIAQVKQIAADVANIRARLPALGA